MAACIHILFNSSFMIISLIRCYIIYALDKASLNKVTGEHLRNCIFRLFFLEKLIVTQMVKNLPAFYGTQGFIITKARHWTLYWTSWIQSTPYFFRTLFFYNILPSVYVSQVVSSLQIVWLKFLICHLSHASYMPWPNNMWWTIKIMNEALYTIFSSFLLLHLF
jgi:hypothetical protein